MALLDEPGWTMQGRPNDAQAIRASLRDPSRFRDVFERHYDDVRRYLQRRAGLDTGEDLAAQTFEEAFRARSRFDPAFTDARPWLMGIATNLLRHHYRAEAARLRTLERATSMAATAAEDDPDARMDARAAAPFIASALLEMGQGERDVLLLYGWAELSYSEIAFALQVPIGTVRSRLHRTRRRLRELGAVVDAIGGGEW
jgi:RNA polymerase sigma factor (sigma-70 family)